MLEEKDIKARSKSFVLSADKEVAERKDTLFLPISLRYSLYENRVLKMLIYWRECKRLQAFC
jgi:hypothetical protein